MNTTIILKLLTVFFGVIAAVKYRKLFTEDFIFKLLLNWIYLHWLPEASDLEKCHYGDKVCLKRVVGTYTKLLKNGRSDLNLVSIDPLIVDEVSVSQGSNSPVNINLKFKNMQGYGLSLATIQDVV